MGIRNTSASFTRPNNTDAYASGDVICDSTSAPTIMTFAHAAPYPGGGGFIMGAVLRDGANVATKADLELWIFDTTITMDNDNAAFTPTDAEAATLVCVIDLGSTPSVGDATSGIGGNAVYQTGNSANLPAPFVCTTSSSSLYGVLVARAAYTPVAQETFSVRLQILEA